MFSDTSQEDALNAGVDLFQDRPTTAAVVQIPRFLYDRSDSDEYPIHDDVDDSNTWTSVQGIS